MNVIVSKAQPSGLEEENKWPNPAGLQMLTDGFCYSLNPIKVHVDNLFCPFLAGTRYSILGAPVY